MPLLFKPPADPLTGSPGVADQPAAAGSAASNVIESDALQRLTKEIERYGRRELAGRSILIAGHRGVGKTTLVRKAIEIARVSRENYTGRPLFVDLHGPDLLAPPDKPAPSKSAADKPDEKAKSANGDAKSGDAKTGNSNKEGETKPAAADAEQGSSEAGANNGAPGKDAPGKQPSGADLQSFVERLTFSLYRAAAKEFVQSFRNLRDSRGPRGESRFNEFSELAEQFALELDGSTDLRRIRLLYERVGAFEDGILNTSSGAATGSQELGLLAASSQAYRIVSGKLDENKKQSDSGTNTANWSIAADNLLSPFAGLLAGSLAWAALGDSLGPLAKLFTSFTTGLASAIAVKFTRTIQRESKQSNELTFVPERDRLALRRLLPVLVDRFCDVGLPPIFVVDELDKVPNISERMEGLMGFLKQFVTERAFFCFLVDRGYYEKLEATVSTSAFPKEATLFGDRLFVQYTPESAHVYLSKVIKVDTLAAGESLDDAERDRAVLPYVLLRRCYMHPFDLRREISRSTNARNEFRFPPRALFNVQQYRNEVYYQVAVECVLASEKMLDFAEDPSRAQLLYDALYFPIRTKKLPAEFDASCDALEKHVAARMGAEDGKLENKEDLSILHDALRALVLFLCEPRALLDTMQSLAVAKYLPAPKIFPPAALGVIEAASGPKPAAAGPAPATDPALPPPAPPPPEPQGKASPLLAEVAAPKYRWQFDRYGYPAAPSAPVPVEANAALEGPAGISALLTALLDDFEEAEKLLTNNRGTAIDIALWEKTRLVPTPPTWSYLTEAAEALGNPASLPAAKLDEYNKALLAYRSNLQSALDGIWSAVAVAVTITVHAAPSRPAAQETGSFDALAQVLAGTSSRDAMLKQLEEISTDVIKDYPLPQDAVGPKASYRSMLAAIQNRAEDARKQSRQSEMDVAQQTGSFYENWFVEFYMGRRPRINALWPFLSWAIGPLPMGLARINPLRMTIAEWTEAIGSDLNTRQGAVSLERLGFRRSAETVQGPITSDRVVSAMLQSIRKRGYERASVILLPLEKTITKEWLPSENIACRLITTVDADLANTDAKYVLVEVDDQIGSQVRVNSIMLGITRKVALFGSVARVPLSFRYPYVQSPLSLDDLVDRLDARPPEGATGPPASAATQRVGTLSVNINLKESRLDGELLAIQGSADPLGDATAFLKGKGFVDGNRTRITGDSGILGTVKVIFMTNAELAA